MPGHPEHLVTPTWMETGNPYFPKAARVGDQWWVLRINAFPDHPLWTLFVDGQRRFDVVDAPPAWGDPAKEAPRLDESEAAAVIGPIAELVAYGSEVGRACDNPFCCG